MLDSTDETNTTHYRSSTFYVMHATTHLLYVFYEPLPDLTGLSARQSGE